MTYFLEGSLFCFSRDHGLKEKVAFCIILSKQICAETNSTKINRKYFLVVKQNLLSLDVLLTLAGLVPFKTKKK